MGVQVRPRRYRRRMTFEQAASRWGDARHITFGWADSDERWPLCSWGRVDEARTARLLAAGNGRILLPDCMWCAAELRRRGEAA